MTGFALRRAAAALAVLAGLSVFCFLLLEAAPGDPARAALEARSGGRPVPEAAVAAERAAMGLDQPLPVRYAEWAGGVLRGDFGVSVLHGRPVAGEIAAALPWTLVLLAAATAVSLAGALAVGLAAGLARSAVLRRGIELAMFVLGGLPGFVGALLLLFTGAVWLGWFPSGGLGRPGAEPGAAAVASAVVLPALALAFGHHFGVYVRLVETGVRRMRGAPHVRAAAARGIPARAVRLRHVLRPGLVPFAARFGVGTAQLIAGAAAVEAVFAWPGLGRLTLEAAQARDFPVLLAAVLVTGAAVVAAGFAADLAAARLDPRTRRTAPHPEPAG
ncbi:ABC transporter permease [Nocardiopsis coralliicola]